MNVSSISITVTCYHLQQLPPVLVRSHGLRGPSGALVAARAEHTHCAAAVVTVRDNTVTVPQHKYSNVEATYRALDS